MPFLIAAVVLVGLFGIVNLLFSFGVIRRLREQSQLIADLERRGTAGPSVSAMLDAGETVGEFAVRTKDDEVVSRDGLSGTTLVGILSTSCPGCQDRLPDFVEYAAGHPGGRDQVLAVVVVTAGEPADAMIDQLTAVARVAEVPAESVGELRTAFGLGGYPAFGLIDQAGVVRAAGFTLESLSPAAVG